MFSANKFFCDKAFINRENDCKMIVAFNTVFAARMFVKFLKPLRNFNQFFISRVSNDQEMNVNFWSKFTDAGQMKLS